MLAVRASSWKQVRGLASARTRPDRAKPSSAGAGVNHPARSRRNDALSERPLAAVFTVAWCAAERVADTTSDEGVVDCRTSPTEDPRS